MYKGDVGVMPSALPFHVRHSGELGAHCIASRDLVPGELVILEAPLVSTRTQIADGLPSADVEWYLVAALLTQGKNGKWAERFCSDVRSNPGDRADEQTAQWLCSQYRCAIEEVAKLHRVVRSNAFGLESSLLGVEYGFRVKTSVCMLRLG